MSQSCDQIYRVDCGCSLQSNRCCVVSWLEVVSKRGNLFCKIECRHILSVHEQSELRFKLCVRAQKSKCYLLRLGKIILLLEIFLDKYWCLDVAEWLSKILFNLIKNLSSNIRVQPQQFPSKILVSCFINCIFDLNELMLGTSPLFVSFQIHKLLQDELVLLRCDSSISLC